MSFGVLSEQYPYLSSNSRSCITLVYFVILQPYGLKAASVYQIGPGSAMTIELDERLLLPVHLDSPSLLSRNAYVVSVGDQPQAPPPSSSSSKADMRRTPSESHVNGQTLVALIDGQLCFRDGKR